MFTVILGLIQFLLYWRFTKEV